MKPGFQYRPFWLSNSCREPLCCKVDVAEDLGAPRLCSLWPRGIVACLFVLAVAGAENSLSLCELKINLSTHPPLTLSFWNSSIIVVIFLNTKLLPSSRVPCHIWSNKCWAGLRIKCVQVKSYIINPMPVLFIFKCGHQQGTNAIRKSHRRIVHYNLSICGTGVHHGWVTSGSVWDKLIHSFLPFLWFSKVETIAS